MPLELNLSPVNSEIADLLASHVTGSYRVVNYSWSPYVLVSPASDQPITVRSSAEVHVNGGTRTLHRPLDVLKFVIMNEGGGLQLKDVGFKTGTRRGKVAAPVFVVCDHGPVAEGKAPGEPRPKRTAKLITLVPVPDPVAPHTAPEMEIPAHLRDLCTREDIHPELGDYLVIPEGQASTYQPLPQWAATTKHVDTVHVRKPRIGYDSPIGT